MTDKQTNDPKLPPCKYMSRCFQERRVERVTKYGQDSWQCDCGFGPWKDTSPFKGQRMAARKTP